MHIFLLGSTCTNSANFAGGLTFLFLLPSVSSMSSAASSFLSFFSLFSFTCSGCGICFAGRPLFRLGLSNPSTLRESSWSGRNKGPSENTAEKLTDDFIYKCNIIVWIKSEPIYKYIDKFVLKLNLFKNILRVDKWFK